MKIWRKYLFMASLKSFFLFLGLIFFLFIMMDFSLNMQDMINLSPSQILRYYGNQWIKQSEILLPLAFIISTSHVLCSFNLNHEWLALRASGLSTINLLGPILILATCIAFFGVIRAEYLLPRAVTSMDSYQKKHFSKKRRAKSFQKERMIYDLPLTDQTKILYQSYDQDKGLLHDVYWLVSSSEIWHCKYLDQTEKVPVGIAVDLLVKDENERFIKASSYDRYSFHAMKIDERVKESMHIPIERRSLSQLYHSITSGDLISKENILALQTHFFYKLIMPFTSLLIAIGVTPFCIRYSRSLKPFVIYSSALTACIAYFILLSAMIIIGENGIINPAIAILGIPLILTGVLFLNFSKKCNI